MLKALGRAWRPIGFFSWGGDFFRFFIPGRPFQWAIKVLTLDFHCKDFIELSLQICKATANLKIKPTSAFVIGLSGRPRVEGGSDRRSSAADGAA
jgi:hypothetical protein